LLQEASASTAPAAIIMYLFIVFFLFFLFFRYFDIPSFRYSVIPLFRYSVIPLFRDSGIPLFRHSGIPIYYFDFSSTANLLLVRISRSWSMTQWMPRSFMALLSWICCDEKEPFLRKSTFTSKKAMPIAIINALDSSIFVIND
jgi:hypothetical protein